MRPRWKSTRFCGNERRITASMQSNDADDDQHQAAQREELTREEEQGVEAELRPRDGACLVGFGDLREERRRVVRSNRGRLRDHLLVLRQLRATDEHVAEADREQEESG